jgi:Raf kinase inhibitor-like YbhB/YbcL family protein
MPNNETRNLTVSSPAFNNEGDIPAKYTCEGEEVNPPLQIDAIPEEAISLALIVEDPDAPKGTFDHWIVWNIEPKSSITENSNPGISGSNNGGKTGYYGPCPPSGSHRYYFTYLRWIQD